jgi:hypothetical protein
MEIPYTWFSSRLSFPCTRESRFVVGRNSLGSRFRGYDGTSVRLVLASYSRMYFEAHEG